MGLSRVVAASRRERQHHRVGSKIAKIGLYSEYSLSLASHFLYLASLFSFLFPSFSAFFVWFWTARFSSFFFFFTFFFIIYKGSCLLGWPVGIGMVHDFWRGA